MEVFLCQGGRSKEFNENMSVLILVILQKNALILIVIEDWNDHQKFKNDHNNVKF